MGNKCCLNKDKDDEDFDEENGIRTNRKQFVEIKKEAGECEELDIYLDPKFNTDVDPNLTEIDQTVLTINQPAVSAVPIPVKVAAKKDEQVLLWKMSSLRTTDTTGTPQTPIKPAEDIDSLASSVGGRSVKEYFVDNLTEFLWQGPENPDEEIEEMVKLNSGVEQALCVKQSMNGIMTFIQNMLMKE